MNPLSAIFLICLILISLWFREGLLFAGAEEQLSFYNYSKSLELFSQVWYAAGTGYSTITSLSRVPYFLLLEPLYSIGISSVLLEAVTFFILIMVGTVSVYYLVKVTIVLDLGEKWQRSIPLLAALFYFLNPFSMTQIWGRALSYQIFSFALIPSFLLFFVLSLRKKSLIFCLIAVLLSFFLSISYSSPAVVVSSWSGIIIYLIFFLYVNRFRREKIIFAFFSFSLLLLLWIIVNLFWVYPTFINGKDMLTHNITANDNIESLKGLSPNSVIQNVMRLTHREYYDGTYPKIFNSIFFVLISWLLPIFTILAIPVIKKSKHFMFYMILGVISVFVTTGANFPTGWLLIWLFETFPILQIMRNPYEKFGINLVIAFTPFFAFGLIQLSVQLGILLKASQLKSFFASVFVFVYFIVLVWPYWDGSFAGGTKANFWVKIPDYYNQANNWLNNQAGDFRVLHLPLLPEEGITYTWQHPYEGVEASEFIFDKSSIARSTKINSSYYSALLDRFGEGGILNDSPYWSDDNTDFKDDNLTSELAKLNINYIIVHFDTDFAKRRAKSPVWTEEYLTRQPDIKKVRNFGGLDIYQVNIPNNVHRIYSPDSNTDYKKISASNYLIDIKGAKGPIRLYFLEQYHPDWEAFIGSFKLENHTKIFSYANSWLINKEGDYQVNIKYKPQESFYLGLRISLVTVTILCIILVIYFLKIRNKLF